jgi:PIN domain nuclease of toxin-antitoxin system
MKKMSAGSFKVHCLAVMDEVQAKRETVVVTKRSKPVAQLSKNARAAIDHARRNGDGLAISDITLLELATLSSKRRIRLNISLESFLREVEVRFIVLPISGRSCVRALGLPAAYPKDPADRIVRSYRAGRRAGSAHGGARDPTVTGSSHHLVRKTVKVDQL